MSNLIFACWRNEDAAVAAETLRRIADRISPDLGREREHRVVLGPGSGLCLTAPVGGVTHGTSAYLGALTRDSKDWHLPGSPVPEGSFALLRMDEDRVEACTDFLGSRTLWYVWDERRFLVSTSQRALVCLLEGFDLNRAALGWFLGGGTLGPTDAWDRRIRRLPLDAKARLDRARWTLDVEAGEVAFQPRRMSDKAWAATFRETLRTTIQGFDFAAERWIVPLSGGYDSRFMLTALYEAGLRPRTVTWGLEASLSQFGNDAYVARKVAHHFDLPHDYLLTELAEAAPAPVVDAFLAAHGGTTDILFPYLDGMKLWSSFATQGIHGIIRGDQGFGFRPKPEKHAQYGVDLVLLSDFMDPAIAEQICDGTQRIPDHLRQRPGESDGTYADRLYHAHRLPVGLASLSDVKAPYLEIANPMLSRPVAELIRAMPDHLRANRRLYGRVTRAYCPPLPYATMSADDNHNDFLRTSAFGTWMADELESDFCHRVLPPPFRQQLLGSVRPAPPSFASSRSLRALLKRVIPSDWVQALRARMGLPYPDGRTLAFRAALVSRLAAILEDDAAWLKSSLSLKGSP